MKRMIYWAFVAPLIVACSNNDIIEEMAENTPVLDSRAASRVEWGDSTDVLHFNNEADFEKAVADLALLDESDDKYALVSSTYGDVTSLKSVYDQAMQDAADLDESKAAYLNYKNKYESFLYFSTYSDDCGAYLPVAERNMAYLLNAYGNVEIAGQIVNKKDISSYEDLQRTGVAMYDAESQPMSRAWSPSFIDHTVDARNGNPGNVGKEYDSGWWKEGKRKVRLKCGRQIVSISGKAKMRLHIEVSFRKKTWLGWANYSSVTETTGTFSGGYDGSISFRKSADSSHDWYQYITKIGSVVDAKGNVLWVNLPINANLTLSFRGIDHTMPVQFTLPQLEAVIGNPTIMP